MSAAMEGTPSANGNTKSSPPRDSKGWDGKLRLNQNKEPILPEAPTPPDTDEEEEADGRRVVEVPGGEIDADEDLLDQIPEDETEIDLNHSRISSIPALRLERFKKVQYLCLRQNQLTSLRFPDDWASNTTLKDLDCYDNSIAHIKGLENLTELISLDLSFNVIKHIKRVNHLKKLRDLFFVQNKISKIEGLEELTELRQLELGANRIRDIENLDTLTNLEELYLGKNKITELKNLHNLPHLRILSLQSNRLTSTSLAHLTSTALPNLTDLYISHNLLTTLTSLSALTNLHILDISSNAITSLSGLEDMRELEELWASNCELHDFAEVERVLAGKEKLGCVYFEGNPLQKRQPALYRNKIKLALPHVRQVDATIIRTD